MTHFSALVTTLALLAIIGILPKTSTLEALHISNIQLRASTNILLFPLVLVVRHSKTMTFPFLIIRRLIVVHLSLIGIIKHATLVHQSIKIPDLMKIDVLINLGPQAILKPEPS